MMVRRVWVLVLAVFAVQLTVLSGCATTAHLAREDDIADLAALKAQTRAIPNHTILVATGDPADPIHIALHQIGDFRHERVLVFIHGILSDHRAWRFIAGDLAQDFDLILVDLPGCGESDRPSPDRLGPGGYSPAGLAAPILEALLPVLRQHPAGERLAITLAGHSLGGAVILQMFCNAGVAEAHADLLLRVDSLVLLSPLEVASIRPDPLFQEIAEASSLKIDAGGITGILESKIVEATRRSVVSPDRALREEARTRLEYLRDPARRRAAQAMIRQAAPWKESRLDWECVEPIEQEYCLIDLPALIVWGRRDETLPIAMGYKLAAEMPASTLVPIPRVMHSPHIEVPQITADLIRSFIRSQSIHSHAGSTPPPP
jgi:pimeloyl-ACP methyl ester carboxylesterase